jgi:hypothetical protein
MTLKSKLAKYQAKMRNSRIKVSFLHQNYQDFKYLPRSKKNRQLLDTYSKLLIRAEVKVL